MSLTRSHLSDQDNDDHPSLSNKWVTLDTGRKWSYISWRAAGGDEGDGGKPYRGRGSHHFQHKSYSFGAILAIWPLHCLTIILTYMFITKVLTMMLEADLDSSGTIEFSEFLQLMKTKYSLHTLLFMISIVRTILVLQLWWQHQYYFAKMTATGTVPMTCSRI